MTADLVRPFCGCGCCSPGKLRVDFNRGRHPHLLLIRSGANCNGGQHVGGQAFDFSSSRQSFDHHWAIDRSKTNSTTVARWPPGQIEPRQNQGQLIDECHCWQLASAPHVMGNHLDVLNRYCTAVRHLPHRFPWLYKPRQLKRRTGRSMWLPWHSREATAATDRAKSPSRYANRKRCWVGRRKQFLQWRPRPLEVDSRVANHFAEWYVLDAQVDLLRWIDAAVEPDADFLGLVES